MVQGWLEVGALVLGDGLEKIPLMNRRPGLYVVQVSTEDGHRERLRSSSAVLFVRKCDI